MPSQGAKGSGTQAGVQQDNVTAFLVGLATDPAKLGRFIQSPDAELDAAGIDEADRAILKSGNAAAIHARIGGQPAAPRPDPMFMLVSMSEDGEGGTRPSVAQNLPMVFAQQMLPMIFAQQPVWPPMIFAHQMPPPMFFTAHQATPMLFMMNASQSPTLPMAPPAAHPHALGAALPLFAGSMMSSPSMPMMGPTMSPMMMSPSPMPMMSPFPSPMPQMMSPMMMSPMMMSPYMMSPMMMGPTMSPMMMSPMMMQPSMPSPFQMMSPMMVSPAAPGGTG